MRPWRLEPARALGPAASAGVGLACAVGSIALRAALVPVLGGEERVSSIFPALLVATFFGGLSGGAICLALTVVGDWYLFLGPPRSFALAPHEGAGLIAISLSGAFMVGGVMAIRRLLADVGEAHEAERRLARELQHRVKNNLAVIEALAIQSSRDAASVDDFLDRFLGRMKSLSAAQALLDASDSGDAPVAEVISATLRPFAGAGQISWRGEDFQLSGSQAVTLALCLHELATNAIKHGALSTPAGSVRVRWGRTPDGAAWVSWEESGGPPPREPERLGSGMPLLRRGLDAGHPARLTFAGEGVSWRAAFRLARPDQAKAAPASERRDE